MARYSYTDGSAARKYAEPAYPGLSPREEARERRLEATRKEAYRNRSRAKNLHIGHMAIYTGYVAVVLAAAFTLAQAQSSIHTRMNHVASLESDISALKADNDAREKALDASVDLDAIREYAVNELGMTYASEDQIRYYTVEKTGYMDQYSSIPQ